MLCNALMNGDYTKIISVNNEVNKRATDIEHYKILQNHNNYKTR